MLKILDTTIRDGSYVIDFQFSPKETAIIARALDDAGIHFIELGHGLGMNAGSKAYMKSPAPEEAYLEAASVAVRKNKWGMFFIPGIGRLEDIEIAAKYSMDFIRIGTNVTESETAKPYIEKAKELGFHVAANFMKTYAVSPVELGRRAKMAKEFGADIVCIVDSAGGMFPEDIEAYYHAIRKETDIAIGFHGHNNLGLGNANALKAAELGCEIIDSSVRGMGRSAGNTVTEIFLYSLLRKNINLNIDIFRLLELGEKIIDPLLKNYQQVNSIGIISGYAQFHSSFLGKIYQYASKYEIDPKALIIKVAELDKVNASDEVVESQARKLKSIRRKPEVINISEEQIFPTPKSSFFAKTFDEQLEMAVGLVKSSTKRYSTKSVFNLVQSIRQTDGFVSLIVNEGIEFSVISGEVQEPWEAEKIINAIDGKVDYLLLDCDLKTHQSRNILNLAQGKCQETQIIKYSDMDVWSKAVAALVMQFIENKDKVIVVGQGLLKENTCRKLENLGVGFIEGNSYEKDEVKDSIVVLFNKQKTGLIQRLNGKCLVLDALIGSLNDEEIKLLHQKNIPILRPQMHQMIQSEILSMIGIANIVRHRQGVGLINGVPVAAGGIVATKGAVILDSVREPQRVFGIANGYGILLKEEELSQSDHDNLKIVEAAIANNLLKNG